MGDVQQGTPELRYGVLSRVYKALQIFILGTDGRWWESPNRWKFYLDLTRLLLAIPILTVGGIIAIPGLLMMVFADRIRPQ